MKAKVILISLTLFLFSGISMAQFGVVRRAINRQIDHKIDSSIQQKAQENKDNQAKEENSQGGAGNASSAEKSKGVGLFGGKIDIKYDDEYNFTGRIHMQMETYDKKDVVKSDFFTYFNSASMNAGIELQTVDPEDKNRIMTTATIFDYKNRAFLALIGMEAKIGTISAIPSDSALAAQAKELNEKAKPPVVTKTGNSRVIAGYKCDEYKVVEADKEGYSLVWMTKDLKLKVDKRNWGKSGMPSYYDYPGFEGMVMLALEGYDKNNKPVMKMETKEINEDFKHSISTVGYKFTKVNFMGAKANKGKK